MTGRRKTLVLGSLLALNVVGTVLATRRGYRFGVNTVVRCRAGHVFTTVWIPGASVKSLRLGWARLQRCPVGRHWTVVTPVRESDLTVEERQFARQNRDFPIP